MRTWLISGLTLTLTVQLSGQQTNWSIEGLGGYSRSFQTSDLNGGLELGAGVFYAMSGRTSLGVEASAFQLGENEMTRTFTTLFPPPPHQITQTLGKAHDGLRVTGVIQKNLGERVVLRGGPGFYRFSAEDSREEQDSTGTIVFPKTVTKRSSSGPGLAAGIGIVVFRPIPRLSIRLQMDLHFMFLSSDDGGLGFVHYASGGIRVAFGL